MKICVLMKQVPDKDSPLKISFDNVTIDKNMVTYATNECDSYTLEEALQIKENIGGEVVVCTFGKESALQVVKDALAKGADRAIFINESDFNSPDIQVIGNIISEKLKEENFDLILSGLQSDDSGNGQLGLIIAEILNMSHATLVMGTEVLTNKTIKVKRELESGWFQWVELDLPASVTIQSGINTPRYASLKGIMGMKKKTIERLSKTDFSSSNLESKTRISQIYIPKKSKETKYIDGSTNEIVEKLTDLFANEIRILG